MTIKSIGKALFVLRDDVDPTAQYYPSRTDYVKFNLVTDSGNTYIAKQDIPQNTPITDTDYFTVIAKKGDPLISYTAYATDSNGTGWTLTYVEGTTIYAATISSNVELDPPTEADFAGATWVRNTGLNGVTVPLLSSLVEGSTDGVENGVVYLELQLKVGNSDLQKTPRLNLYDKLTMNTIDTGIDNTGAIISVPNWTLAKIPVSENTTYSFSHNDNKYLQNSVGMLGYYDADNNQLSAIDMSLLGSAGGFGGKTLTTPPNCTQIWKNVMVLSSNYVDDFQLEEGVSTSEYQNYTIEISKIQGVELKDTYARTLLSGVDVVNKATWFLGDSITWNPAYYLNKLFEKLKFTTYYNIAVSGAKWSHEATTVYDTTTTGGSIADWNCIWNQANKMKDMVDNSGAPAPELVIISAGTNDLAYPDGTPSDIFDGLDILSTSPGDARLRSVSGGLRYTVDTIIRDFPLAQIILITPIQRGIVNNSKMFSTSDVMIECGGFGAMKVIDQSRESGIYGFWEISGEKYLVDNLHPNDAGGQKMANYLNVKLRGLIEQ